MIEPNPCQGCTERFIACSDKCPKDARGEFGHKAWKERYQAEQKHLKDNRYRFSVPLSAARERSSRAYLKFGGGHQKGGSQ